MVRISPPAFATIAWVTAIVLAASAPTVFAWLRLQGLRSSPAEASGPREPLTLALSVQPTSALVIVALEQGYFAAVGLDVTVKEYPSGKRALLEGLLAGEAQLAISSGIPVVIASFERKDFRILAETFSADNINRIVARRDRGIATPTDLGGKHLATQRASAVHYFLHLYLMEQGLTDEDVTLSFLRAEDLPAALAEGRVDAFSMREPYISEAQRLLGDRAVVFADSGLYKQVEIAVATEALVKDRPMAVERVIRALIEADAFVRADPEAAMGIVARRLGVERTAIAAIWPTIVLRLSLGQDLLLLLEDEAKWAIQDGLINATQMPNYLDLIYPGSLAKLRPEAVTIIR